MHALLRQLLSTVRQRGLFPEPGLVVAAVSGGPDSVALLHALQELAPGLGLELLVAHLDHGLRGDEGSRDAALVGELAGVLGLPVEVGIRRVEPPPGSSLEEVARNVRYAFLGDVAARHRARYIAIAHTADDQAETLLMRLLRGAGPRGLRAMTPIATRAGVAVVRPLLDAPRDLVRSYLNERQLPFRLDRTNRDLDLERNRIRHVLMPLLSSEFNPSVVASLGRTAEIMNEVDEHLTAEAQAAIDSGILRPLRPHTLGPGGPRLDGNERRAEATAGADGALAYGSTGDGGSAAGSSPDAAGPGALVPAHLELDLKRLSTYDRTLQRMLIRQAILRLRRDLRGIGFGHVDALLGLAGSGGGDNRVIKKGRPRQGWRVDLPGGVVGFREGDCLSLWAADPGEAKSIPLTQVVLDGKVALPEVGLAVDTRLVKLSEPGADLTVSLDKRSRGAVAEPGETAGDGVVRAVFDRARLHFPVAVRSRRNGDRLLGGRSAAERKVKDLLIDARVPRRLRSAVPLLVDGAGSGQERILWVAGIRRSVHAPVSQSTTEILEVSLSTSGS